jgi:septum formation protein
MSKLILASASPQRQELLKQIGITPDLVIPSEINETQLKNELPRQYAMRVAEQKAMAIAKSNPGDFILSADTIVYCGRKILPKANNDADVKKFLKALSGKQHSVLTAVCVISSAGKAAAKLVVTRVKFKVLSAAEIEVYIKSGEGIGKAGGYAIQGMAGAFVKNINGSYSGVVGLPLYETTNLLLGMGYKNE